MGQTGRTVTGNLRYGIWSFELDLQIGTSSANAIRASRLRRLHEQAGYKTAALPPASTHANVTCDPGGAHIRVSLGDQAVPVLPFRLQRCVAPACVDADLLFCSQRLCCECTQPMNPALLNPNHSDLLQEMSRARISSSDASVMSMRRPGAPRGGDCQTLYLSFRVRPFGSMFTAPTSCTGGEHGPAYGRSSAR